MEQFKATENYTKRSRIYDIFSSKGPLSFKEAKEEYEDKYGEEFPFQGDANIIEEVLLKFGIRLNLSTGLYDVIREKQMRQKPSISTPHGKRARSVPSVQFEDEIEEKSTGFRNGQEVDEEKHEAAMDNADILRTPQTRPSRVSRFKESKDFCSRPRRRRSINLRSKSEYRSKLLGKPNICGTIIIADDFFIGIATKILNYKAEKTRSGLQSGLCVSGLTIPKATNLVNDLDDDGRYKTAIVYIGSIDIINGNYLVNIMSDYIEFLNVCHLKGISVIGCTLAPIPKIMFNEARLECFKAFNTFLCTKLNIPVIDVHKCMVEPDTEQFIETYYQPPNNGKNFHITFWSSEGNKRVYDCVMKNLGLALLGDEKRIFDIV